MKNKKLVCLLTAALTLALTVFASAAEKGGVEAVSSAQADTSFSLMALREGVVDVSVPSTGTLYINPLGFPVNYEYDGETITDNSQILTEPAYIENNGEDPVSVSVSVTGEVQGGELSLTSSYTKNQTTSLKKAFVYFEIQPVSDPGSVTWDEAYDSAKHVYVRNAYAKSKKNIVELEASGGGASCGAFRLTGDCVKKPRAPWTEEDGLKVTIAFTFTPIISVS